MSRTTCHVSVSLDGYLAGPGQTRAEPLGGGGDPPYHAPVVVLTHHARDPVELAGGARLFEGVTDPGLTQLGVTSSPRVTHIRYRVG